MDFDAVILAGGRSSRLGGVPKARLVVDGLTLLERSLQAAGGAARIVVVGPDSGTLSPAVLGCREDPPFGGPAAAIAAGLTALAGARSDSRRGPAAFTLVLACDMPRVSDAVGPLLNAVADPAGAEDGPDQNPDGAVAVSVDGRIQPLVGLYGTPALQRAVDNAAQRGALEGGSVFALLASLELRTVPVPPGSTDDVDTWDDASALGASNPGYNRAGAPAANDLGGKP